MYIKVRYWGGTNQNRGGNIYIYIQVVFKRDDRKNPIYGRTKTKVPFSCQHTIKNSRPPRLLKDIGTMNFLP